MSAPLILNPTNAWVRIEHGAHVLLIDPWMTQGANHGTWFHRLPLENPAQYLEGVTHVAITHLHEDHFDLPTLLSLPDSVTFCVPDIGPNRTVIAAPLRAAGKTVVMLPPEESIDLGPFRLTAIPPMDGRSETYSIDAGIFVEWSGWSGLFMADNVPRNIVGVPGRAVGADLLALSYNGLASDYPLCYGFSDVETGDIVRAREEERFRVNCEFIRWVKPKMLLLYSSDMAIAGPQADRFRELNSWGWWATGYDSVDLWRRYRKEFMLPVRIVADGIKTRSYVGTLPENPLVALVGTEPVELARLSGEAFESVAARWPDDWSLRLEATDTGRWFMFDTRLLTTKLLTCRAPSAYLAALLRGDLHWNTAQISFNLQWRREPNVYEPKLYDAINHLHV